MENYKRISRVDIWKKYPDHSKELIEKHYRFLKSIEEYFGELIAANDDHSFRWLDHMILELLVEARIELNVSTFIRKERKH